MISWNSVKEFRPFNVGKCQFSRVDYKPCETDESMNLDVFPLCTDLAANSGKLQFINCTVAMQLLTNLSLNDNSIENIGFLENLPNLVILKIAANRLKSESLDPLKFVQKLEYLDISFNLIQSVGNLECKSLKTLHFTDNLLKDLNFISHCSFLKTVNVSHNKLRDVKHLFFLNHLQCVDISFNKIKRIEDIEFLSTMNIIDLNFMDCPFYVKSKYYEMVYINIFCKCKRLNQSLVLEQDKVMAIKYFQALPAVVSKTTVVSSFDMLHKQAPFSRVVIMLEMGVSYASRLVKDAPFMFSLAPLSNKIQLCPHQFSSWLNDETLAVTNSIEVIDHPHLLAIHLGFDDYDYNRFRTMLMEFVLD
eukprot:NODE_170_length_16226_cov_0.451169.p4 type:complete len:362 gc:universal NODE_170_length_16226_cov_0.451169:8876-7791(-)